MDAPGPYRPLLPDFWSVYAVGESDVELRSPGRSVRLSGSGVGSLLPDLLPVLDGEHTVDEICAALAGCSAEVVERLVAQLAAGGLLVAGGHLGQPQAAGSGVIEFLQALACPGDVGHLSARLEGAAVCLWGDDRISRSIEGLLLDCQVSTHRLPCNGEQPATEAAADLVSRASLLVGCGASLRDASLLQLNALSLATGTPWLPIISDAAEITLGPLIVPGRSACLVCLRVRAEALAPGPVRLIRVGSRPMLPAAVQVAAGVAVVEVLKALLGADRPTLEDKLIRIHLRTLAWTRADVLRLPRCPACASVRPGRRQVSVPCSVQL